jgi:hypothetical protein
VILCALCLSFPEFYMCFSSSQYRSIVRKGLPCICDANNLWSPLTTMLAKEKDFIPTVSFVILRILSVILH